MQLLMIFNGVFHQGVGIDQEYLPTNHGFDHYMVSCQACTFHIVSFLKMSGGYAVAANVSTYSASGVSE